MSASDQTTPGTRSRESSPALEVRGLSKTFTGTRALDDVDIAFRRNSITALLGPNGCGKSTLIKILAGFHDPDPGATIEIGGEPLGLPVSAREARARGLTFVHQDLALVEDMDVADNLAFPGEFGRRSPWSSIGRRGRHKQARKVLERLGLETSPDTLVRDLSRTDQIMVAVARAFESDAEPARRVVTLDEPTASLPAGSVDAVLEAVLRIKAAGGTVIYVTHRIDEVLRIADDVVVLRDGRVAASRSVADLDLESLGALIAGAHVRRTDRSADRAARGEAVLEVEGLGGRRLRDVSFTVRSGEILGVAGLAGCGRSELARILGGVSPPSAGKVIFEGRPLELSSPRQAQRQGVAYVPPDRGRLGVLGDLSVGQNIVLSNLSPLWGRGILSRRRERTEVATLMDSYDIRPRRPELPMRQLSGGNQQKGVIAKVMRLNPKLIVVDEPTQGVDIAGKQEIAAVLSQAAAQGRSVVLASSDFDEIAELCDRVLVLDRGAVVGIYQHGEIHDRDLAAVVAQVEVAG